MTGTGKKDRSGEREALQRLLECYGSDRTRWPAKSRLRFAGLLAADHMATAMLAEARALDRLIDRAPRVPLARERALVERLVAVAVLERRLLAQARAPEVGGQAAEPAPAHASAVPVADAPAASGLMGPRLVAKNPMITRWPRPRWQSAGLLAASLVVGVLVGQAGLVSPLVQDISTAVGIETETEAGQLALVSDPSLVADPEEAL